MRIVYKLLTRSNGIIRAVKLQVDILSGTGHSNPLELGCDHELTKGANQIEIYKNKKKSVSKTCNSVCSSGEERLNEDEH